MKRFLTSTLWNLSLIAGALLAFDSRAATGTVVDAKGAPVADAAVDFYQYPSQVGIATFDLELKQHVTSDSKGSFTLPSLEGAIFVIVKKAGLAVGWKTWNPLLGPTEGAIVLSAPAPLAGIVVDENGQPLRDAEVWVTLAIRDTMETVRSPSDILVGKPARDCFSARTSADGKFRIANFPAGAQAVVAASRPGKALRQNRNTGMASLPHRSGQEDIQLVLEPAGVIEGKLTAKDTGEPLMRATLLAQPVSAGFYTAATSPQPIQSGAGGVFRIPDMPAGSYRISATFPSPVEWVTESVPVTVAAGETVRDVALQAIKGGVVEVTAVSRADRKPLAGVSINAYREGFQASASVNSNGVAFVRLPPGQFTLMAAKQGWSQMQSPATVQAGQTNRVRVELTPASKISGIIRDPSGAPVAGARVSVLPNFGGNNNEAKTDRDGRYEVTWQQPSFPGMQMQRQSLFLLARSVERNLAGTHNVNEATTNLDLRIEPGMTVSARVQEANGKPIVGATASLMVRSDDGGSSTSSQPSRTDERGRVSFPAMPMGRRYGMWINANGYGSANNQDHSAEAGQTNLEFPVFTLKLANRKIAGKVLSTDGKPVAGAQVYFNGDGQPNASAQTDAKGEFAFDAVCEGPLSVSASQQGVYGNVDAMGGDTNVVIRFSARNVAFGNERTATITGTVVNSSGAPASGVSIIVTPAFGMMRGDVVTDSSGKFSIDWSPQRMGANAKFFLLARDLERNLAAAQEITDSTTTAELRLEQGLTLSGSVQDIDGAPVRVANINVNFIAGNMGGMVDNKVLQVDERGAFTVPALPAGHQYSINATANGYGSMNRQVRPAETRTNRLELPAFKLKRADRQLAGRVLDPDNKPIPGAQVNINGNGQPNGNTRADASGYFTFKVCEGPISVMAYQPRSTAGPVNSGNVQARGGDTNIIVKIGVRQPRGGGGGFGQVTRATPLKAQSWTWNTIKSWPARHKTAAKILLGLQIVVLAGTAGAAFWFTRSRSR